MNGLRTLKLAGLLAILASAAAAAADERQGEGEHLYLEHCSKCHGMLYSSRVPAAGESEQVVAGLESGLAFALPFGPNLTGVVGRAAGAVPGYSYSKAFLKALSGSVWSAASVAAFIADSQAMAPGSRMFYQQPDAEVRRLIVEFLEASARG